MPTEGTNSGEGDQGQGQGQGTQQQAQGQGTQQDPTTADDLLTNPAVQKIIAEAVTQAKKDAEADLRKKAKADADKKKAADDEDYQKLYETAQQELRDKHVKVVRAQASVLAAQLNAVDPVVVAALVPADTDDDEDAIKKAVAKVRTDHPKLFATTSVGGGSGNGNNGSTAQNPDDMNAAIRRATGRIT